MFLEFRQFLPEALEARHTSIRSDTITGFYQRHRGDLDLTVVMTGGDAWEVAESYEEVKKMVTQAEAKDRTGT